MQSNDCFLCRKHLGQENPPPGGYIYEDASWMVCHAPVDKGPLGTLFIESRRHVLDFEAFNEEECRSFGALTRRIYSVLRPMLGAHRIYQISMMEGIPHFHAWLVPRTPDIAEIGITFLAKDLTCTESAARDLAVALHAVLQTT
jgi:diadenosine tetraphosphate (Ap4A) HIT family hydrolase